MVLSLAAVALGGEKDSDSWDLANPPKSSRAAQYRKKAFASWDETYLHDHHPEGRTVLMVRDAMPGDPHTEPEPWTWVRTQGQGRVFYTASGHDHRVWSRPEFHQLLRA